MTTADSTLASRRLRQDCIKAALPSEVFATIAPRPMEDATTVVFSKHFEPTDVETAYALKGKAHIVYDVCDLHFADAGSKVAEHYLAMLKVADTITANTKGMVEAIAEATGRGAVYIPDCTETPLKDVKAPTGANRLLWYGHASNWPPMFAQLPLDGYRLEVVSRGIVRTPQNWYAVTDWTPMAQRQALDRCDAVVIAQDDTLKAQVKSHNRVTEAVRAGRYVVSDAVVREYAIYPTWRGDIREGLQWAFSHPEEAAEQVREAQRISERFLPEKVAPLWLDVFARGLR